CCLSSIALAMGSGAYQYIMMMFAVFHNRDFLDYFYKKFPSLPRVKCFSHWLKLMTLSVQPRVSD
ncbi:hypothetical protein, partial [Serratia marcescens]|uniref:hypothetical protein n=1 Tax=Serratia marcescens TaxID=615 RepID=UPI0013DAC563